MVHGLKTKLTAFTMLMGTLSPVALAAAEITLKSTDGTINVTGEFVALEDDSYVVRTPLGDLRIGASRVVCEGLGCPTLDSAPADVAIVGSEAIGQGMMPLLMNGYAATLDADAELTNPAVGQSLATLISDGGFGDEIGNFLVTSTNDASAFEALLDNSANIAMSSRRILREEARALRAAGAGSMVDPSQERIIAIDSMVVATHASNPVDHLSVEQLRAIFAGEISNWQEVGGPDSQINVIMRADDTASHEFFMEFLYGDERPSFLPQGIASDDQSLSNVLYSDKHAIGYLGYSFQRGAKPVTLINECGIAVTPDAFSAKTEEYALNRRMYLYNRGDNLDQQSKDFLNFVTSEEADSVIAKSGFIDLGISRRSQTDGDARAQLLEAEVARYDVGFEGELMGAMLDQMQSYDRLSTTLRFRTGSAKIDERGKLDIARLITHLETAPAGSNVMLVGFTDDVGAFDSNRDLSIGRAEQVRAEILDKAAGRLDHINFGVEGFGEVAPSACNVSDRGRSINRRVEVWIADSAES